MGSTKGYQEAVRSVSDTRYRDNWHRTFRGMPDFSAGELEMLTEFAKDNEYGKMAIYLTKDEFGYCLDSDMVEFVIREIAGNV